jgi:peptidoglycan/LPS O-acetylase OafA/YrhL
MSRPAQAVPGPTARLGYVPELEALRGIAIALVVAFHANGHAGGMLGTPRFVSPAFAFIAAGNVGVDLFFVLSAFLLARPFVIEAMGAPAVDRRRYAGRRIRRILPMYLLVVGIATALSMEHPSDLARAVPYMFFLHGFVSPTLAPYSNVWWSLATEVQFYLLLPLLAVAFRTRRRVAVAFVIYAAVYAAFLCDVFPVGHRAKWRFGVSVLGQGGPFLAGIVAAWIHARFGDGLRTRLDAVGWLRRGGADVLLVLAVWMMARLLCWAVSIRPVTRLGLPPLQGWHVLAGFMWATIVLLVLVMPVRLKWLLANRPLEWLGTISYSLFLIHGAAILLLFRWLRHHWPRTFAGWSYATIAAVTAEIIVLLAVSALTYRFIERPFLVDRATAASSHPERSRSVA